MIERNPAEVIMDIGHVMYGLIKISMIPSSVKMNVLSLSPF